MSLFLCLAKLAQQVQFSYLQFCCFIFQLQNHFNLLLGAQYQSQLLLQYQRSNMEKRHSAHRFPGIYKNLENRMSFEKENFYEPQQLMQKIRQIEAKLDEESATIKMLRMMNSQLETKVSEGDQTINDLKQQNDLHRKTIINLQKQLHKIIQLKDEVTFESEIVKQKNYKMCEIVKLLQKQNEEFSRKQTLWKSTEEGLRKRIQQLIGQNENMKRRMAKCQVQTEKYKLKAIEGEKYWSSKIQKNRHKDEQVMMGRLKDLQEKYREKLIEEKANCLRYEKILKMKQEQIKSLQNKIEEFFMLGK